MKKSLILVLSLPLLLSSCVIKMGGQTTDQNQGQQTSQTGDQSGTQAGGQSSQGTEGSTTGDDTETGGESTTGGGTETGGQTTGGGTETGGSTETGGGTTTGGGATVETNNVEIVFDKIDATSGTKDGVSFEARKESAATAPAINATERDLRIYAKGSFVVSAETNITKIIFNISSQGKKRQADIAVNSGSITYNLDNNIVIWTGNTNNIVFTVGEKSTQGSDAGKSAGQFCFYSIIVTKGTGSEGGTTGGGTTGGETTGGGGQTTGGGSEQSGNGNTSSEWTTPWTGLQYDIAYSLFKGNLPCLKAFTGYAVGCVDGSSIMYFNPYVEGWSKDSQTYYDNALRDMGYTKTSEDVDEDGDTWFNYQKGTYKVRTSHYRSPENGKYYFDVYANNDYEAPFKLDYTPTVDLTTDVYPIKSGYKQFSKTIKDITFTCSDCTENSGYIQLRKQSTMEITSNTALSKLDISFNYEAACCLVYAGTSSSTAKIVYNNGNHWDLPSGTKYVKLLAVSTEDNVQIDCLSIK